MKKINIQIKLKSPTLLSNGEPEGLYDESYMQDQYRLPVFPAKRLKGLLRESCTELLEWSGNGSKAKDIIDFIFGKTGASNETTSSRIQIFNGEIIRRSEWVDIILKSHECPKILAAIDSYFSMKVAQTQIKEDGIAKEGSLRQFKLLAPKEDACFETTIVLSNELEGDLIHLIKAGLINIRRVGTGRNRGWGKVHLKLEDNQVFENMDWENLAIPVIQHNEKHLDLTQSRKDFEIEENSFETIPIKITAKSHLIFPKWNGDENTVSTKDHIPGSMLWGAFAGKYIKAFGKGMRNIMDDTSFRYLFYEGGIKFKAAFPYDNKKIYTYSPKHWVQSKLKPKDSYRNMFDEIIPSGKPEGSLSHFNMMKGEYGVLNLQKTQSFHNSRGTDEDSRLAGTNQNSGIYYYESVNKGTVFYTDLKIDTGYENKLMELIEEGEFRIGKSKNNQFGQASVEVVPQLNKLESLKGNKFDITFESPTILINEKGFSDLSKSNLAQTLNISKSKITNTNIRKETIQRFQGNLNVLLPANEAITPGSSFRIEELTESELEELKHRRETGIGLETEKGFGQFRVDPIKENLEFKKVELATEDRTDFKLDGIEGEIAEKIKFELEKKKAQRLGFEMAGKNKRRNEYKNGVYQAINWLASCEGEIDEVKWTQFKKGASKKVKEKFIKRHDLLNINNNFNSSKSNQIKYIIAWAYVERLKSNLN